MSEFTKLMLQYSEGELEMNEALLIEKRILENEGLKKEYLLNQRLNEYMRLEQMMQQIHNDQGLAEIEATTKDDINKYVSIEAEKDQGVALFINSAIKQNNEVEILIDGAEREMHISGIDNQVNEWVQAWEKEKIQSDNPDSYTRELIDYVKLGMNEGLKPEIRLLDNKIRKKSRLLVYISSTAAILILVLGFSSLFNSKTSPNELFADNYEPYKIVNEQTRSYEYQYNNKYIEAIKLYQKGIFIEAGALFKELLNDNPKPAKIQLLYGISQLENKQYDSALANFKEIIDNNGEYVIDAKWYMALIYLKKDDIKSAGLLLKELAETPGYYKDKSKEILEKL